jgi:hypothetical protein
MAKNEEEWFDSIVEQSNKKNNVCVYIIFKKEETLLNFLEVKKSAFREFKQEIYFATDNWMSAEGDTTEKVLLEYEKFEILISDKKSGRAGKVLLLTETFGRGVDFSSDPEVKKKGGAHVIQTFFSKDKKEQIQIQGRGARKHYPGGYELVLNYKDFLPENDPDWNLRSMYKNLECYKKLGTLRNEIGNSRVEKMMEIIREKTGQSTKVLNFRKACMLANGNPDGMMVNFFSWVAYNLGFGARAANSEDS